MSRLGTPQDSSGWRELLVVLLILGAIATVEWMLGGRLRRFFRRPRDEGENQG